MKIWAAKNLENTNNTQNKKRRGYLYLQVHI